MRMSEENIYVCCILAPNCLSGHITADKRLRFTLPKLPSATSFIRKTLSEFRPFAASKYIKSR